MKPVSYKNKQKKNVTWKNGNVKEEVRLAPEKKTEAHIHRYKNKKSTGDKK